MVVQIIEYEDCAIVQFDDGDKVVMTSEGILSL